MASSEQTVTVAGRAYLVEWHSSGERRGYTVWRTPTRGRHIGISPESDEYRAVVAECETLAYERLPDYAKAIYDANKAKLEDR